MGKSLFAVRHGMVFLEEGAPPFCTEAEFKTIEPSYTGLPPNCVICEYNPTSGPRPNHLRVFEREDGGYTQDGGPDPWEIGDVILARVSGYPAKLAAAFPDAVQPEPTPEEMADAFMASRTEMEAMLQTIARLAGVPIDVVRATYRTNLIAVLSPLPR